jgi:hypothetical protein
MRNMLEMFCMCSAKSLPPMGLHGVQCKYMLTVETSTDMVQYEESLIVS